MQHPVVLSIVQKAQLNPWCLSSLSSYNKLTTVVCTLQFMSCVPFQASSVCSSQEATLWCSFACMSLWLLTWYALRISYTQEESDKKGKRKKKDLSRKNHSFFKKSQYWIRRIYRLSMNTQNQLFSVEKIKRFLQGWHHVTARRWHHKQGSRGDYIAFMGRLLLFQFSVAEKENYYFLFSNIQAESSLLPCAPDLSQPSFLPCIIHLSLSPINNIQRQNALHQI